MSVCVIDDDAYYNALVTKIVQDAAEENGQSINITSFQDGYQCIEDSGSAPDVVFLDFYLSNTNDITQTGLDVLKKLKEKHPQSKVIFISQEHEWANFKDELISEGATDFIKKDEHLPQAIHDIVKNQ